MDRLIYKIHLAEYCLDRLCIQASSVGITYFEHEQIKHHWVYNKILINTVIIIVLIREIISLLLKNRELSLMLGDMTYDWEFKSIWNLIIINSILFALSMRGLHYWYFKHGYIPIRLRKTENNFQPGRKARSIITFVESYFVEVIFAYPFFFIQMITFSKSCTIFELFTYGLFWSCLMFPWTFYMVQCFINQCLYFCLLAYNLKLRLEFENIRLKQLSTKQLPKVLIERQLLRIISRIFKIYKQIKDENKFWSKWLLIQLSLMTNISSLLINQLLFEETNMFIFVFFIILLIILLTYIWIFSISCIKLHDESNKTVKIIRQLNFKLCGMKSIMYKRNLKVILYLNTKQLINKYINASI